ncbi:F-box protein CPR1-like [Argentina anserina]|uniref:F-box protein CPR1-like n=1 Tax=Argentina anserina TaxID=57926 RepID=UPI0021768E5D|nr:F-box protein CPR1-like [Potentilla anserina]XP_050364821.1 F-box protein CPR1-like [Potentilla anserina]
MEQEEVRVDSITGLPLPCDVMMDIIKRLPPKELLRCRACRKSFKALIGTPEFYQVHLNWSRETNSYRTLVMGESDSDSDFFSSAFYDRDAFSSAQLIKQPLKVPRNMGLVTYIVGCWNGLICLHIIWGDDVAIWNPCIQKFKMIPRVPDETTKGAVGIGEATYGFGYSGGDYKVVRFMELEREGTKVLDSEIVVYSLRSSSWKKIEFRESSSCTWDTSYVIPLDGALHWFGKLHRSNSTSGILTLNFTNEKVMEFRAPDEVEAQLHTSSAGLSELNGKLCIIDFHDKANYDIWAMNIYGKAESWTRLYTIKSTVVNWTFDWRLPLASSSTGRKILLYDGSGSRNVRLFWYDSEKDTAKRVRIPGMPSDFTAAICVANLGLLDGESVIKEEDGSEGDIQFEIIEGSEQRDISEGESSRQGGMSGGKRVRTK